MERYDVFQDIAQRTEGDIYIGVVGPVRTGKSTFIKRFMDLLVMPNIRDQYDRERTKDELPQSGAGKSIMTTEPKFVPNEAVEINIGEGATVRIRLVDCVGYTVKGAVGYEDEGAPRMVLTPWYEHAIPFQEAAETGTRKVIKDHSTIGVVVITDGSITDIPRENYIEAEERVIRELKELGKPFIIILNSMDPNSENTRTLAGILTEKYNVQVIPADCLRMSSDEIVRMLQGVLYEFPIRELNVEIPKWVAELSMDNELRAAFQDAIMEGVERISKVKDVKGMAEFLGGFDFVESSGIKSISLGEGAATIKLTASRELFFKILSQISGFEIEGEHNLVTLISELSHAKKEYDKVAVALREVRESGYGIVSPILDEISFLEPELIRKGGQFGVRLRAKAPSIHMIRADIETEVSPVVGTEKQGEELVRKLSEEFEKNPDEIWQKDFLGTPLYDLIKSGIESKLVRMPDNAQEKLRETLERIVNDGSAGLICIIL